MTTVALDTVPQTRPADRPERFLSGSAGDAELTEQLVGMVLRPPRWLTWVIVAMGLVTLVLFGAITYTVLTGVGVWGNNVPVAWAFAITNFVWWIGIGHAGTFISAFLLLLEQKWRTSINRFAEAMTLFAVVQAGLFPVLHLGRPWFAYWLIPYPSTMGVWPQFRSSLPWDVVAVTTYFTVSLLFWYLGLVPDLATIRDYAPGLWKRRIYGLFALGFRGDARTWSRYRVLYGVIGGLATPLVVSVHSIVSMDFAISQLPGWHSVIFPPYFVAGAIFSGFAMVLTLMIPIRSLYGLQNVITTAHLDAMGKMLLLTGSIVGYAYVVEMYSAWYSGDTFERFLYLQSRPFGPFAAAFWIVIACNVVVPQVLWSRRARTSPIILFVITLFIQLGMWMERFMLIVSSLAQDFLPSSWRSYRPSAIDLTILFGTIGFFLFLFFILIKYVPFIPISELKETRFKIQGEARGGPVKGP